MVFSPLHWIPSALAALLTFSLAVNAYGKQHKGLSVATVLLALLGLVGYISAGSFRFFPIDFNTFHVWVGLSTLTLSICLFVDKIVIHKLEAAKHCYLGKLVALLAAITLVMGVIKAWYQYGISIVRHTRDFLGFGIILCGLGTH